MKGHLPRSETRRVQKIFAAAPPDVAKVLVVHHNVLAGGTGRMGLARWRSAHKRLLATGADVILCGHDHHEGAGQIEGGVAVSTSGTHSYRQRGGRPSVFNLVNIDEQSVHIQHFRWVSENRHFIPSDTVLVRPQGCAQGGGVGGGWGSGTVTGDGEAGKRGSGDGAARCCSGNGWPCSASGMSSESSPTPTVR